MIWAAYSHLIEEVTGPQGLDDKPKVTVPVSSKAGL